MSSSISASKDTGERGSWRSWLSTFGIVLVGLVGLQLLLIVLLDPFDSGRFPSLGIVGTFETNSRLANVSLGRDPQFNAAIVGNSTAMLLHPGRLSQLAGPSFVQLSVPNTGPIEQTKLLRWFVRHHRDIGAIVMATDRTWCAQDTALPLKEPFPFWLYSESNLEYLSNVFSQRSLERAVQRVRMSLGLRPRNRTAGYFDYAAWYRGKARARLEVGPIHPSEPVGSQVEVDLAFPALDRLAHLLTELPSLPPMVFVIPPSFVTTIPRQGTAEALRISSCKARLARIATSHGKPFLDFWLDGASTRDPDNFMDEVHMSHKLVQQVEAAIATALSSQR